MYHAKVTRTLCTLTVLLAVLLTGSCFQGSRQVRMDAPAKGVQVISDIGIYRSQTAENPDMELVDLEKSVKNVILDIRYASADNFTKQVIYTQAKAYLRKPVAEALNRVAEFLVQHNAGIKVYDAYRPYAATVLFYQVYPDKNFVADPRFGSRHNRGCAVDLTLYDLRTGRDFPMPSGFDDFSDKARPDYTELPKDVLNNRTFLFTVMEKFGFRHYPTEWWHFDYRDWEKYPLMDLSFDQLSALPQP